MIYNNGKCVSTEKNNTKFITKINKDNTFNFNVITLDLETRLLKKPVISGSIYDGDKFYTFLLLIILVLKIWLKIWLNFCYNINIIIIMFIYIILVSLILSS